jgi:C-terminal processing protease CtpA/Prc
MKHLMMVGLLGLCGVAAAQSESVPPEQLLLMAQADAAKAEAKANKNEAKLAGDAAKAEAKANKNEAKLAADEAKAEAKANKNEAKLAADEAKTRAELDAARKRLDDAARDVAKLSGELAMNEGHNFVWIDNGGPRRAVLGVQIDPESGKDGARVLGVSPGGAAAEAGVLKGDVIVALDGQNIAGADNPHRAVVEHMREVKADQKVKVKVLRAGKNKDLVVVARPMTIAGRQAFDIAIPDIEPMIARTMPMIRQFRVFPGGFGGMELASITPKLGAYFGASEGVLVVQAPKDAAFKLEDGDVIQSIDGRKPEDGAHALRILRSYKSGEKLNLSVLRQRKPVTLAVTMPERPDFDGDFLDVPPPPEPPMPPAPPTPAVPAVPARPAGSA